MQYSLEPVDVQPKKNHRRRTIIAAVSVLMVVILAVASALLVKYYVVASYIVDGISMYPTLDGGAGPNTEFATTEEEYSRIISNGETLYLNKIAKIKRGDIVVFTPDDWGISDVNGKHSSLVKRVIAIGGDRIKISNNKVYLNGELLSEDYINEPMRDNEDNEWDIPNGYIFCMGDNRNHSTDCRVFGPISLDCVVGKCFLIKSINGKLRSCK